MQAELGNYRAMEPITGKQSVLSKGSSPSRYHVSTPLFLQERDSVTPSQS